MLALVNGMDAVSYKQLWNLTACFGYPNLLSSGWVVSVTTTLRDASFCEYNGCCDFPTVIDDISCQMNGRCEKKSKQLRSLTACFGYPIMLSDGMDAVKSPNPNGC